MTLENKNKDWLPPRSCFGGPAIQLIGDNKGIEIELVRYSMDREM